MVDVTGLEEPADELAQRLKAAECELEHMQDNRDHWQEQAEKEEVKANELAGHLEAGRAIVRELLEVEDAFEDPYVVNSRAVRAEEWLEQTRSSLTTVEPTNRPEGAAQVEETMGAGLHGLLTMVPECNDCGWHERFKREKAEVALAHLKAQWLVETAKALREAEARSNLEPDEEVPLEDVELIDMWDVSQVSEWMTERANELLRNAERGE